MTGQIVPNKSNISDNAGADGFKSFFFNKLNILSDMGYKKITSSVSRISLGEIDWVANYLYDYDRKLRTEGFSSKTRNYFLTTKSMAIISLWHGYIISGGVSPPPLKKPFPTSTANQPIQPSKRTKPKGAVVIPTKIIGKNSRSLNILRNTLSVLAKCRLLSQIMLIGTFDDGAYEAFEKEIKVKVIELENDIGPSYARNAGIDISLDSRCDVIVFMDDDAIVNREADIERLIMLAYKCNGMAAPLIRSLNKSWFDSYHDFDGTLNGVYSDGCRLLYATTCSVAISRNVFEDGLKFDEDFKLAAGEDIDLSLRASKSGFPIFGIDDIVISHNYGYSSTDHDLDAFIDRYVRYGKGNATLFRKHPYYYTLLSTARERRTIVNHHNFMFKSPKLSQLFKLKGGKAK